MKKRFLFVLLLVILGLSAYLRLYHISDYMTFLGDEGRDVLVAKNILEGDLTLLGPRSSAGDFFMGPAYYYMITPFLWLFRYDPVGPAVMVAVLSVATTWLIYFVGKKWFNQLAGLFAAALYAVSPVVITYSHSSWNPNVLPFFALLLLYFLFTAVQSPQSMKRFLFVGFLLGIAIQLHYLALLLCLTVAVYLIAADWYRHRRIVLMPLVKRYLSVFVGFLLGFSPFLLFEIRHGFPNIRTIFRFVFSDSAQSGYESGGTYLSTITDVFFRIFAKLVFYFPSPDRYQMFSPFQLDAFRIFIILMIVGALITLFVRTKNKLVLMLISLWLFLGILVLGFYKKSIYDYLFTFIFPLPFLLIGFFLSSFFTWGKNRTARILFSLIGLGLFIGIFIHNYNGMPFQYSANRQKEQVKTIAEVVVNEADGNPYNFALISNGNSDHAYRYYLDVLGNPPVVIDNPIMDPQRKTVTEQLIVVCEDPNCEPLGHPFFDVASFGRAEVVSEQEVIVVKVFKLIHYDEQKSNE